MKRIIILLLAVSISGCAWFVPTSIKRESTIVRVDIDTAGKEVIKLQEDAKKSLKEGDLLALEERWQESSASYKIASLKYEESINKMMRSYNRVKPHSANIENYMLEKKADN
jgi:hypothetical protein